MICTMPRRLNLEVRPVKRPTRNNVVFLAQMRYLIPLLLIACLFSCKKDDPKPDPIEPPVSLSNFLDLEGTWEFMTQCHLTYCNSSDSAVYVAVITDGGAVEHTDVSVPLITNHIMTGTSNNLEGWAGGFVTTGTPVHWYTVDIDTAYFYQRKGVTDLEDTLIVRKWLRIN